MPITACPMYFPAGFDFDQARVLFQLVATA